MNKKYEIELLEMIIKAEVEKLRKEVDQVGARNLSIVELKKRLEVLNND